MRSYANYNNIAFFYDLLCKLVFGQKIKNAQIHSLQYISSGSNILIVGGGTGWILEEIAKIHSFGLRIMYVDSSSKMIQLSKKRNIALNTIEFIHASIEDVDLSQQKYDVVLTPFLFDNFRQSTALSVFKKLNMSLKYGGYWLYIDFYISDKNKYQQKVVLKLMYIFFRSMCNIEANKLPYMADYFSSYKTISNSYNCNNFIITQVFQK